MARVDNELAPGLVLDGNYQLVQRIGGGGMGVVYRARDLRLGRDVAIKILKPGDGTDDHLRRLFEREARTTAQLLHPNIVTLHHVGEHGGHPYLVLELLGGETLAERILSRGPIPLPEALAIFDGVLAALAFAHERGVLHRDIKPSNVFVTLDRRIKVLDFGVAFSLATHAGTVTRGAGTPGYMAPEQSVGAAQDPRTDLWAATMLFVECVAGRHVDLREASQVVAGLALPPAVQAILARSLAIDPAYRPASVTEVRSVLATQGAATQATGPQPHHHAPPPPLAPPHRHRARWPFVVLALALAGGVAIAIVATRESSNTTVHNTTIHNTHDGADVTNIYAGSAGSAKATTPSAPPPAPSSPASDNGKTLADIHQWAGAEKCAHEIQAADPMLAARILAQVQRETPNEAIAKQIPEVLQKQGLAAARALAATLSRDSVYVDEVNGQFAYVESELEEAHQHELEGDCVALAKLGEIKVLAYEVGKLECHAETNDKPCKAQDVLEDARFEYNRGNEAKALGMLDQLIACQHGKVVAGTEYRALEAACRARDEAAAKAHFGKLPEAWQRDAIRFCHGCNIALP